MSSKVPLLFVSTRPNDGRRNNNAYQKLRAFGAAFDLTYVGRCEPVSGTLAPSTTIQTVPKGRRALYRAVWAAAGDLRSGTETALVVTPWTLGEMLAGFLAQRRGLKWIALIWDDPQKPSLFRLADSNGARRVANECWIRIQKTLVRQMLRRADLVIANINVDVLAEKYDVLTDRVLASRNGVDLSLDYPAATPRSDDDSHFVVAYAGPIQRVKIELLTEAVAQVESSIPGLRVRIVGPVKTPADLAWIAAQNEAHPVYDVVAGMQPHDETLQILASADVCVVPYPRSHDINATYPTKVFEYMALGAAIVSSRTWGTEQVLDHRVNGMLFDPEDPKDLARQLLELASDEQLRRSIAAQAPIDAKKHDWAVINQQMTEEVCDFFGLRN